MNKAALELSTVQSNVTARVKSLEAEVGFALFERTSRGVTLTAAGRRLLPFAARAARLLEDAKRAVADQGTPTGALVVGSLETTAALRLSPILSEFAAKYPAVDLSLRTGTSRELVDQVLGRSLEGAYVCGPVNHPDLLAEPFAREELVILTAPAHRRFRDSGGKAGSENRGAESRLLLSPAAGGHAGAARYRRREAVGIRHVRGHHQLCQRGPRRDPATEGAAGAGLGTPACCDPSFAGRREVGRDRFHQASRSVRLKRAARVSGFGPTGHVEGHRRRIDLFVIAASDNGDLIKPLPDALVVP
jgi:DNA-binding transcriptional LysR family regulator